MRSTQSATERVQTLRGEYWNHVKQIDPNNLVFLDENMPGLTGLETLTETSTPGAHDFQGSIIQSLGSCDGLEEIGVDNPEYDESLAKIGKDEKEEESYDD